MIDNMKQLIYHYPPAIHQLRNLANPPRERPFFLRADPSVKTGAEGAEQRSLVLHFYPVLSDEPAQ